MRILIVKLSSIGDGVHALPAAAALRRGFPEAHIAWAVERRARAILEESPIVDDLIEVDSRGWRRRWHNRETLDNVSSTLRSLRGSRPGGSSESFDVAVDFQGLLKSGLLAFASGATRRIGFETQELRERASRLFLTEQVETSHLEHVIDKNLALAHRFINNNGLPKTDYEFPIYVSPEDESYAGKVMAEVGG